MSPDDLYSLLLSLPIILFALSAHEFSHAVVSTSLGDPTPGRAGRLTLLPWAHLDPFGTIMLIISSLSGFGFGWARPVPIDPTYYRHPMRGVLLVSLAGPAANFALAAAFGTIVRYAWGTMAPAVQRLVVSGVAINLGLFIFNLIPIPPLDGSGILAYFLRGRIRDQYLQFQRFGFLILMLVIMTGLFDRILIYPFKFLFHVMTGYYIG